MSMHAALDLSADHPSFAGHFPGYPVLPGAVLLDEALRAIAGARSLDLTQWQVSSVKFLELVRPGDALDLEHDARQPGSIRFTIRIGDRKVASGALSSIAQGSA